MFSAMIGGAFGIYALWPANMERGYQPDQPIDYSHRLHAGEMKIDCKYCHHNVEGAAHANTPSVSVCMNCHEQVQPRGADGTLKADIRTLIDCWDGLKPIEWVNVHNLADFVYFNHSRHVSAGLECQECHGPIETMEEVWRFSSLKMGWCLDCHKKDPPPNYPVTDGRNTWSAIYCFTCHR
jgi:hypothetical protein